MFFENIFNIYNIRKTSEHEFMSEFEPIPDHVHCIFVINKGCKLGENPVYMIINIDNSIKTKKLCSIFIFIYIVHMYANNYHTNGMIWKRKDTRV